MNQNHCKDCKHFGEEYEAWNVERDEMVGTGYHRCLYVQHAGQDWDLRESTKNAAVIDGSGYFAALTVKDDFGCVNFEPKE